MADTDNDILIDGKSIYSLRVVDLKQELKKRDIPFKTNATKAQLQSLLIPYLSQTVDAVEDKSSEDNSRLTSHSEDTNETIESNPEVNNVNTIEDSKPNEVQTEPTDLSQDSGITSSVSFGDRQSIKLTIKLGPNDSPTKQLSPKKSPVKEMKSPVIVEEVKSIEDIQTKHTDVIPDIPPIKDDVISQTDSTTDLDTLPAKNIEQNNESKIEEKSPKKLDIQEKDEKRKTIAEVPKTDEIVEEVLKADEIIESIPENETSKPIDLSSVESNELQQKPEERNETNDSISVAEVVTNKEVTFADIVISEEISEELTEQKFEPSISSSEKESESLNSMQSVSEVKTKDLPSDESLISTQNEPKPQKEDKIEDKTVEKENKKEESEDKIKKLEEPKVDKPKPPRRRRWGGSTTNDSQQSTKKGISSDQLKDLIPDLNSTDNSNTASKVSKSDSIVVTSSLSRTQTTEEITEIPAKRDIRVVRKSVSVPEEEQTVTEEPAKTSQPIVEQKAKIVVESEPEPKLTETEVTREVGPPQKAESNIVFIRNLVRPFTLLQLKEVLGKTGKLTEERFWIDKIKSKCFATYQTNEEAVATRLALHGTRWPASNPKLLAVDFATNEELDSHLEPDLNKDKDINNKMIDKEFNKKYDIVIRTEEQRNVLREKDNKNESRPIREWDREKLVNKDDDKKARRRPNSPITRSRSRERDPKRRRTGEERVRPADSTSEEAPATEAVKRTESPAKLLDDLFRKTTATPSIYWLPLTEEQALARVGIREEEEKKRAEERTAREEQFRKRQEERRPFEANSPPFRNERNQWRPDSSPNRRMFSRRGSAPRRSPPGRRSPPRRRSPVNRFSRSRSRSPFARRKR